MRAPNLAMAMSIAMPLLGKAHDDAHRPGALGILSPTPLAPVSQSLDQPEQADKGQDTQRNNQSQQG